MRVAWSGNVAYYGRQVELEYALVLGALQAVRPQSGGFGVGFHQLDLFIVTTGELQVFDGLLVDVEHRRGGAELRRHIGDSRAVAQRQVGGAFTVELQVGGHHFLRAQEFGQRQHDVRRSNALLRLAAQFHADDVRQAHPGSAAQHHAFGLQATHADGDYAQGVDHRGVAVGADQRIRKSDAVFYLHYRTHAFEVDLVQDTVTRRNHVDVLERFFGPVDEVETVFVTTIFDGAVLGERVRIGTAALHRQRVVYHQLRRHDRVYQGRVTALKGNGVTQAGEVNQCGLAQDVMTNHTRREPWKIQVALALDELFQGIVQGGGVTTAHQVLSQYA